MIGALISAGVAATMVATAVAHGPTGEPERAAATLTVHHPGGGGSPVRDR